MRDFENNRVIVPNSVISTQVIVNANLTETKVCKMIEIGVGYDSDIGKALKIMEEEISNENFETPKIDIISNVTSEPVNEISDIKKLLISQIEKPVRWREIINYMINKNINKFIEIGPGKVLSGLVKRINRNAELIQINDLEDLKKL